MRRLRSALGLGLALAVGLTGCKHRTNAPPREQVPVVAHDAGALAVAPVDAAAAAVVLPPAPPVPEPPLGLPPVPAQAGITPEAVALGALLFEEVKLSSGGQTACATCHVPTRNFSGTAQQLAADGKPNLRRAPALVNLAYVTALGWDGRYTALADQLAAHAKGQLGTGGDALVAGIATDPVYRAHFARVPGGPAPSAAVALAALAAYVQTRYAGDAPWDREERAPDAPADVRAGYALFGGKAQCAVCHTPPLYTDQRFHAVGLVRVPDEGHGRVDPAAAGAFRTPTLRGAALRPAFFHDGSAVTLDAAIDWHLAGGTGQGADPSIIDPALRPVTLTPAERAQLGAFVGALTGS